MPPIVRAFACMAISTLLFAVMHAMIRHASSTGAMHPFEIAFFRNLFGVLMLVPMLLRPGTATLRTKRLPLLGLRAILNSGAMLSYFLALSLSPLALVTSLGFSAPLFATVFAAVLLREAVHLRRILALLAGFAGMLMIVRPGVVPLDAGAISAIVSAVFWGCCLIIIKALSRTESSFTITFYMVAMMTPITLVAAIPFWTWPDAELLLYLMILGFAGTAGQWLMAQAMREADASAVLPLDFLKIVWAVLIGLFFFAEVPHFMTVIGGTVVFAAATYITIRESKLAKRQPAVPVSPRS